VQEQYGLAVRADSRLAVAKITLKMVIETVDLV
jgi:hypothetical protein